MALLLYLLYSSNGSALWLSLFVSRRWALIVLKRVNCPGSWKSWWDPGMRGRGCCCRFLFDGVIECIDSFLNGCLAQPWHSMLPYVLYSSYDFGAAAHCFYYVLGIYSFNLVDLNAQLAIFCLNTIFHFLNL